MNPSTNVFKLFKQGTHYASPFIIHGVEVYGMDQNQFIKMYRDTLGFDSVEEPVLEYNSIPKTKIDGKDVILKEALNDYFSKTATENHKKALSTLVTRMNYGGGRKSRRKGRRRRYKSRRL